MNEEQTTRLECLHLAGHAAGEDVPFEYILEGAESFYDFVMKTKKAEVARIVPIRPDGGGIP